jgi:hypothetical protein
VSISETDIPFPYTLFTMNVDNPIDEFEGEKDDAEGQEEEARTPGSAMDGIYPLRA